MKENGSTGANSIQRPEPSTPSENRAAPRYKCEGSAEFRTEGFEVHTWARVTDLSLVGCYLEMQATSPLKTAVSLMIEVNGLRAHINGLVRTSFSMQGMGIAFTEISDTDRLQLAEIIRQLAIGPSSTPDAAQSSGLDLLMIIDASAALNAVASFFQSHRTMSRDEFKGLVGTSQRPGTRDR